MYKLYINGKFVARGYVENMIEMFANFLKNNDMKEHEEHELKIVKINEAFNTGYTLQEIKNFLPSIEEERTSFYMKYLVEKLEWYEMMHEAKKEH